MRGINLFASIALALCLAACSSGNRLDSGTQTATIDRQDVERILSVLSADDMRGRRTFSPEIDSASAFIQAEFEEIGLETMAGLDSYEQAFRIYSFKPTRQTVVLNGTEIGPEQLAASVNRDTVLFKSSSDVEVHIAASSDRLRALFGSLRQSDTDALVLVGEGAMEYYERIHRFMSRPQRVTGLGQANNVVYVATSDTVVTDFSAEIISEVDELKLANVAGQISGRLDNEFVLFSAHHDHIGIVNPVEGDSIANGANDDASGTAAVIALARYFRNLPQPERTLLFVTFTAEEMGGYGSRHFSEQLDPASIVAMFNIEMIGKPAVEGPNTAWITGFERSDFGEILQRAVADSPYEFYPDPYPSQNLFFRSDNATLARLGVPAHSISTTPIDVDKDYHRVSDEVETLDIDHMVNTIKAISKGAETIISGVETPTRVEM